MGNRRAPKVPAGTKWCHGCEAALPLGAFGTRMYRGGRVPQSRCRPCLDVQRRASAKLLAELHARWDAAEAARVYVEPLPLPEEIDLG